jgi:hypothetical protein
MKVMWEGDECNTGFIERDVSIRIWGASSLLELEVGKSFAMNFDHVEGVHITAVSRTGRKN